MRLYFDLDLSHFVSGPGTRDLVREMTLIRGDLLPVIIQFCRGVETVDLGGAATGAIGIKPLGVFDDGLLAYVGSWAKIGSGPSAEYHFELNLNTAGLNDLLGVGAAPDVPSVQTNFELEFVNSGRRTSSNKILCTIENDVVRGDETAPAPLPNTIADIAPRVMPRAPGSADVEAEGGFTNAGGILVARALAPGSTLNGVQVTLIDDNSLSGGAQLDGSSTAEHWKVRIDTNGLSSYGDLEIGIGYLNAILSGAAAGIEIIHIASEPEWEAFPSISGGNPAVATLAGGSLLDVPEAPGQRWVWPAAGRMWSATDDDDPPVWREFLFAGDNISAPLITATGGTVMLGTSQLVSWGPGYFWTLPPATATLAHTGPQAQTFAGPLQAPNQTAANPSSLMTRSLVEQLILAGRHAKDTWAGWAATSSAGSASINLTADAPFAQMLTGTTANSAILLRTSTTYRTPYLGKPGVAYNATHWDLPLLATVRFYILHGASDAQAKVIWRFGESRLSATIGELTQKGIGFTIENRALFALVHNGTSQTKVSLGHTVSDVVLTAITFESNGAGTWNFFVNGTLAGTTELGPSGTGSNDGYQIAASITNGTTEAQRQFRFEPLEILYL